MSYHETLVQCGDNQGLSGVLTHPEARDPSLPTVILLNSGLVRRIGTRRLSVKLARRLAASGFLVMRFDLSGMGDSAAKSSGVDYLTSAREDLQTVQSYLHSQQSSNTFIVGGLCSGADVALLAAGADPRIRGVIQLNAFIHKNLRYYLHQIPRPQWWRSVLDRFLVRGGAEAGAGGTDAPWGDPPSHAAQEALYVALAQQKTHLLSVFTTGYISYAEQLRDVYAQASLTEQSRCILRLQGDHVISPTHDQHFVINAVSRWCVDSFGATTRS